MGVSAATYVVRVGWEKKQIWKETKVHSEMDSVYGIFFFGIQAEITVSVIYKSLEVRSEIWT